VILVVFIRARFTDEDAFLLLDGTILTKPGRNRLLSSAFADLAVVTSPVFLKVLGRVRSSFPHDKMKQQEISIQVF
jgi:hypothetical protein